jgi:hypothetical protein
VAVVGDAQLSSDFFDLLTFIISFYVGSGLGLRECIPVRFLPFRFRYGNADTLGGEELVGEAQLSSDFLKFVDFCKFRIRIRSAFRFRFHNSAGILGGEELVGEAQHYWEVKMTRPVYGTDVMIGLTTQASPTEIHFTKIIQSVILSFFIIVISVADQ